MNIPERSVAAEPKTASNGSAPSPIISESAQPSARPGIADGVSRHNTERASDILIWTANDALPGIMKFCKTVVTAYTAAIMPARET